MNRVAKFEKVSSTQFNIDLTTCGKNENCYEDIILPKRSSKYSAGYDFYAPYDFTVNINEKLVIASGVRCKIEGEYFLMLAPRSSLGFKYQLGLANTVAIIDADYYNTANEGHILISLVNRGDKPVSIKKGERFCQGIFLNYAICIDDDNDDVRTGGLGSSGL